MMKKLHLALMLFGFLELLLGVNPAWSQTACGPAFVGNPNFCHVTVSQLLVPPSPPAKVLKPADAANPGYPLHLVFIFLCSDLFDGHLIDCGYSVEVLKAVDSSPNEPNAENGGHIASKHGSAHPLIEPKGSGLFDFAGSPDSTGIVVASPPDPPKIHFGTAIALEKLQQIAQKYFNTTNDENNPTEQKRKLKINDISLVRGGVFDLNLNWVGDNQNDPHWGHRTGTEVDIETKDSL